MHNNAPANNSIVSVHVAIKNNEINDTLAFLQHAFRRCDAKRRKSHDATTVAVSNGSAIVALDLIPRSNDADPPKSATQSPINQNGFSAGADLSWPKFRREYRISKKLVDN